MRSAGKKKVNVFEMKCLRSLVGVSRLDRVRNEEVPWRAGIERIGEVSGSEIIEMVWANEENG